MRAENSEGLVLVLVLVLSLSLSDLNPVKERDARSLGWALSCSTLLCRLCLGAGLTQVKPKYSVL